MNTLFCPLTIEGKNVKEALEKAGIDFTTVQKEADSTVRLFTESSSYKGAGQIVGYAQAFKSEVEMGKDWEDYARTRSTPDEIDLRG